MKRLLVVIVTSAAVALLVLLPHGGERWIWVRLLIAVVLVWGVIRNRGAWLDALLGGYIALLGAALFMVMFHDPGAPRTTFEPRARLVLPNVVVAPIRRFEEQADVVLIVVEEKRGDRGRVTHYETHRFEARLREDLPSESVPTDVEVSIERGADDENLLELTRVTAGAAQIHVKEVPPDR